MKPKRETRYQTILFLIVFFALNLERPGLAQGKMSILLLEGFVPAYGGSCQSGYPNVLAGSMFDLSLINTADEPLELLQRGWPEGYSLEAALDLPQDQPFNATPDLIEKLSPTPFLTFDNLFNERKLLLGDSSHVRKRGLNKKHFAIHVPADLVGHTVTIRALFHHGGLSLQSTPERGNLPISIIAPCDRADTARIVGSWVFVAWASNDSNRVITLADSMLACNLSDAIAWNYAHTTALRLAQFNKALAYLDRMYQDFGVTDVNEKVGSAGVPRVNHDGPRDPLQQQLYERQRNELLQVIAREEQQHK
jgi:hypothetical protein